MRTCLPSVNLVTRRLAVRLESSLPGRTPPRELHSISLVPPETRAGFAIHVQAEESVHILEVNLVKYVSRHNPKKGQI